MLIAALTATAVMALLFFALHFTRILGANEQQRTAIQAAALSAASDLAKIKIEDDYFGFIALSDSAPIGKDTLARDQYPLPVTGINTLLATIRLDMIIADQLDNEVMRRNARRDYGAAIRARDKLMTVLSDIVTSKSSGTDADGNVINPWKSAREVYLANRINMAGGNSNLLDPTLKLDLGYIENLPSNIELPNPSKFSQMFPDQQKQGLYKANLDIKYGGLSFVFASLAKGTRLADHNSFVSSLPGGTQGISTIVRCQADQDFQETDNMGRRIQRRVHMIAAAEPGALVDPRPAPGILSLSMPDGSVPEISKLSDCIIGGDISGSPSDRTASPTLNDFPPDPMADTILSGFVDTHPLMSELASQSIYDWLRRMGPRVNVQSLFDALSKDLDKGGGPGLMHIFEPDQNGKIQYRTTVKDPLIGMPVSQKQWRATSGLAVHQANTPNKFYDVYIRDFVAQPGRIQGGMHGGEPFPIFDSSIAATTPLEFSLADERLSTFYRFPSGGGSGERPTYRKSGIAVDIKFRSR